MTSWISVRWLTIRYLPRGEAGILSLPTWYHSDRDVNDGKLDDQSYECIPRIYIKGSKSHLEEVGNIPSL